jgi:hypothetical protein
LINTLDCVVIMSHAIVKKKQTRRLGAIVEVINVNPDGIAMTNTPFVWNPADDKFYFKKDSRVFEKIKKRYGLTNDELSREFTIRTKLIYEMYRRKIFDFNETQKIINEYYKNPEVVLKQFGISAGGTGQPQSGSAPRGGSGQRGSGPQSGSARRGLPSAGRRMRRRLGG